MFEYKKNKDKFFIISDKIKWEYWPFEWAFVRNKYLWDIETSLIDEKKYPGYKYSVWKLKNKLFVIWLEGIVEILKINT